MATPKAAREYSEQLRKALKAQFLDASDSDTEDQQAHPSLIEAEESLGLTDLEKELEAFRDHQVVKGILDQGCDLHSYAKEVEEKLRKVELDSIQDYIQESDSLASLHQQVSLPYRFLLSLLHSDD